jgi:ABC-type lipoprotein export system ATPase subunit
MVTHDLRFAGCAKRSVHLFDGRVVEESMADSGSPVVETRAQA